MIEPRTLLLATTNHGKLREVQAVLAGLPMRLITLEDVLAMPEPVEDGLTFEANAALKAVYYSMRAGVWALADDSGLEVDALDGAPGVISARYANSTATTRAERDLDNNRRLIYELRNIPEDRRTARFRCALALADGNRIVASATGAIEGRIIDEPRGRNGFGYDPHFFVPELGCTTAELPPTQKTQISHRGRALAALRGWFSELELRISD